jgi:carbonic anhydrase
MECIAPGAWHGQRRSDEEVVSVKDLIAGYRRFMAQRWPEEHGLFSTLARGQKPQSLVIGCSDSRVDPATIFSARPGEMFIIRNVASIVPPYEIGGGYHGTSAAIAFAVLNLKVSTILVLGHGQCGGVAAALEDVPTADRTPFVSDWVDLLAPAIARCRHSSDLQTTAEKESVKLSIERLLGFPFVADAVRSGRLEIGGAHFGIADGKLSVLDRETGAFQVVDR